MDLNFHNCYHLEDAPTTSITTKKLRKVTPVTLTILQFVFDML